MEKLSKNLVSIYEKCGSEPVHHELRTVILYCLGLGTLWGFLMALMINLSVQLYLRNKEMRFIQVKHLRWDLSCISAAGVLDGILLALHTGKADEHPVLLMIWSDKYSLDASAVAQVN
jgi:hypothetical protein